MTDPCLLEYRITTEPSPLVVSPPVGTKARGRIRIAIAEPKGDAVMCGEIDLKLLRDALAVPRTAISVTPSSTAWVVTAPDADPEPEEPEHGAAPVTWRVRPRSGGRVRMTEELVLTVDVEAVAPPPGPVTLTTAERTARGTDPLVARTCDHTIEKAASEAYLDSFVAFPGSEAVRRRPLGEVLPGEAVVLQWRSNAPQFCLYAGDDLVWGPAGDTRHELPSGLQRTTTLRLVALPPKRDPPLPELVATLTLTVAGAPVTARSLSTGCLGASGTARLGEVTAHDVRMRGALGVDDRAALGAATVAPAAATTAPVLTVIGGARVRGQATLASATVGGILTATGTVKAKALSVAGLRLARGLRALRAWGWQTHGRFDEGDWMLHGWVTSPGNAWARCVERPYGALTEVTRDVVGTGGNLCTWMRDKNDYGMSERPASFVLPVPARVSAHGSVRNEPDNEASAPAGLTLVNFGIDRILAGAPEPVAAAAPEPEPQAPDGDPAPGRDAEREAVAEAVAAAADAVGGLAAPERERLAAALDRLVRHAD